MKIFLFLLLIGAVSSIQITCLFWYVNWPPLPQYYSCEVTAMNFTDNSTHITGYRGSHFYGYSVADVEELHFSSDFCSNFNLTFVPKGILDVFPNVIGLGFGECAIDTLTGDELVEYPNSQWFYIYDSNLTHVPGNFFNVTPNMRVVHFDFNLIELVGVGLLNELQNLEVAWFVGNVCIDQYASNPQQLMELKEALYQKCSGLALETTTKLPPKCEIGDLEDFVCGLEEEIEVLQNEIEDLKKSNEDLIESNKNLQERTETLEDDVAEVKEFCKNINESMKEAIEDLEAQIKSLGSENLDLKSEVRALDEKVELLKAENEEFRANLTACCAV